MYWAKVHRICFEWMKEEFGKAGFGEYDLEAVISMVGKEVLFAGDVFSSDFETAEVEVPASTSDVPVKMLVGFSQFGQDDWYIEVTEGKIDSEGQMYVDMDDIL